MDYTLLPAPTVATLRDRWLDHPFYKSAIVLGIDIGIEGIGLYLRKGREEIFAASVMMELPEAQPLAGRRGKRAARHCRDNRAKRMKRLKTLFAEHGLPWEDEIALSKADPFDIRYRAINTHVASPQALAIAIRHCVNRRGYDYEIASDPAEGDNPWGDSMKGADVRKWVQDSFIDEEIAQRLIGMVDEFTWAGNEAKQEEAKQAFIEFIPVRVQWSAENSVEKVLKEHHRSDKHTNLKKSARGYNFPRKEMERHLREIITRHPNLLPRTQEFLAALFFRAQKRSEKKRAIFHYNRKTLGEMKRHWASKRRSCIYAEQLGLPKSKADSNKEWAVRRWNLLEFLAFRRVEIVSSARTKGATKAKNLHRLSPDAIRSLIDLAAEDGHSVDKEKGKRIRPIIEADASAAHPDHKITLATASKDEDHNKSFFDQLRDLIVPTQAKLGSTSSLCKAAAERLFAEATGGDAEPDYAPDSIERRLKALQYFLWKRRPRFDFGCYPQVEKLIGPPLALQKHATTKAQACGGILGRIFQEHAAALGGTLAPDYCIVEVAGDMPRNQEQKRDMLKEMKERREKRDAAFAELEKKDTGATSRRRRISLHGQQKGHCPFTGEPLPEDPLSDTLEIEHLFPTSLGGLTQDDNLVLTTRTINGLKGNRTPLQFSKDNGPAWKTMMDAIRDMKWSKQKREIFAWGEKPEHSQNGNLLFPPFNNTTRIGQLARQLTASVGYWLGVVDDADETARRIATPTGWHTAQARRSWLKDDQGTDYKKCRQNNTHHLIDAAVLAHIPPREGLNSTAYGGIFETEVVGTRTFTHALPDLLPPGLLLPWMPADGVYPVCPILKYRSGSKVQSLGDDSFWRQFREGEATLAQRTKLNPTHKDMDTGDKLHSILKRMTPEDPKAAEYWLRNLPTIKQCEAWIDRSTPAFKAAAKGEKDEPECLKLKDGTPIRTVWKFDGKGSLFSRVGWSGKASADHRPAEIRSLTEKYDRLELWLGYKHHAKDPKKSAWEYQTRRIPSKKALAHLKRLGLYWGRDRSKKAPIFMQPENTQKQPDKWLTLRDIVCPPLLPFSIRLKDCQLAEFQDALDQSIFRKGDVLRLSLKADGGLANFAEIVRWKDWYAVSAIKGDGKIELKHIIYKEQQGSPYARCTGDVLTRQPAAASVLAHQCGLPPAADLAVLLQLTPPPHDPPPTPPRSLLKNPTLTSFKNGPGLKVW